MRKLTTKQIEAIENKTRIQLEGIIEAKKIYNEIIKTGYANLNELQIKEIRIVIKNLKGFYIKEIVTMFDKLVKYIEKDQSKVIQQLIDINTILVKSQNYLEQKLLDVENVEDRELEMFIQSTHTFNSLKKDNSIKEANIALLTLTKDPQGSNKSIEIWLGLENLELYKSKDMLANLEHNYVDYSPYLQVDEMAVYPEINTPKITFKEYKVKQLLNQHYTHIIENCNSDYDQVESEIKNYLKHPLHKYGYYLVQLNTIHDLDQFYIIENSKQQSLKIAKSNDYPPTEFKYISSQLIDCGAALIEAKKDQNHNITLNLKQVITKDGHYTVN